MKFRAEKKHLSAFSYASLTDVVLQLLIFFLLSSTFVMQTGVKVQLPKAVHQEQDVKGQIIVTLTADGLIYLNNQQITQSALQYAISQLLQDSKVDVVIIQADKKVTLQQTVDIMDIAKAAGATRFLIATQPTN